ncbi:MAG: 5'-nucleotidase, lipoprotein e(P4) family [Desulforhopalus sp.]
MNWVQQSVAVVLLGILSSGCVSHTDGLPAGRSDNNFNSTLWMQRSAEYVANSLQTYNTAAKNLETAVNDPSVTAAIEQTTKYGSLPPAIIMDIDETVLDNSAYDAKLILEAGSYSYPSWDQWISLQQATAIPGAVNFINHAKSSGIEVIFITNRMCKKRQPPLDTCPQKSDTINNLEKVGISNIQSSTVLLRGEQAGWSAEKASRRTLVAEKYRIIMLFGDDLGDFLPNVKKDITPEERAKLTADYTEKWGRAWYVLPNPSYGSWLRVLKNPKSQYLRGY